MLLHFVLFFLLCTVIANSVDSFFNLIILNRETEVSDQGLTALGSYLKDLKSLTKLSQDFEYL